MQETIGKLLESVFSVGFMHSATYVIAIGVQVLGFLTLFLEIGGRTISTKGIVKNGIRWNSQSLATVAIVGALYTAVRFLQTPQIIPGFGGLTFTHVFAPIFGMVFGVPGAIGCALSTPISDAIMGYLSVGSLAGTMGHWLALCWLPMKMVKDPSFTNAKSIVSVYVWGVVVGGALHVIQLVGFLDLIKSVTPVVGWAVMAPGSVLAHIVLPAILMPLTLPFIFKTVKKRGMYWRDLQNTDAPAP